MQGHSLFAAFSALLRLLLLHRLVSLDDAVHFGQMCLEMEAVGRGDEGLNTGEPKNRPAPNHVPSAIRTWNCRV